MKDQSVSSVLPSTHKHPRQYRTVGWSVPARERGRERLREQKKCTPTSPLREYPASNRGGLQPAAAPQAQHPGPQTRYRHTTILLQSSPIRLYNNIPVHPASFPTCCPPGSNQHNNATSQRPPHTSLVVRDRLNQRLSLLQFTSRLRLFFPFQLPCGCIGV